MKERDCANCKHHTSDGCSSWDCEFERAMTREEAREALSVLKIYDAPWLREAIDMAIEALKAEPIRCKECRFAMVRTEEEMNKPIKPQPILCEWFCIGVENNDFCSHGERREP